MTPATQREIWGTDTLLRPRVYEVTDEAVTWSEVEPVAPTLELDTLLDDFCDLANAHPEEMAAFMVRYAVPELYGSELTDDSSVRSRRPGRVAVRSVRRFARGVAASRRVAADLVVRRPGDLADWRDMQEVGRFVWGPARDDLDDWKLGRERFAQWMTKFLDDAGMTVRAEWRATRGLALEPSPTSLLGVVALLLSREVGAEAPTPATRAAAASTVLGRPAPASASTATGRSASASSSAEPGGVARATPLHEGG